MLSLQASLLCLARLVTLQCSCGSDLFSSERDVCGRGLRTRLVPDRVVILENKKDKLSDSVCCLKANLGEII